MPYLAFEPLSPGSYVDDCGAHSSSVRTCYLSLIGQLEVREGIAAFCALCYRHFQVIFSVQQERKGLGRIF